MAQKEQIEKLIDELEDYRTRSRARRQLEALGSEAAPRLQEILTDQERKPNARWAALRVLSSCGYQDAAPNILQVARDSTNLRGEACRALERMFDQELGEDLEAWERVLRGESAYEETESTETGEFVPFQEHELEQIKEILGDVVSEVNLEDEGYIYMILPAKEDRTQQLILSRTGGLGQTTTLSLYTRCGSFPEASETDLTTFTDQLDYGYLFEEQDAEGNSAVAMQMDFPADRLADSAYMRTVVPYIAQEADRLEQEWVGKDQI